MSVNQSLEAPAAALGASAVSGSRRTVYRVFSAAAWSPASKPVLETRVAASEWSVARPVEANPASAPPPARNPVETPAPPPAPCSKDLLAVTCHWHLSFRKGSTKPVRYGVYHAYPANPSTPDPANESRPPSAPRLHQTFYRVFQGTPSGVLSVVTSVHVWQSDARGVRLSEPSRTSPSSHAAASTRPASKAGPTSPERFPGLARVAASAAAPAPALGTTAATAVTTATARSLTLTKEGNKEEAPAVPTRVAIALAPPKTAARATSAVMTLCSAEARDREQAAFDEYAALCGCVRKL